MIIAKVYGSAVVGEVALVTSLLTFAALFSTFGTNTAILRVMPEYISKYSWSEAFFAYRKVVNLVLRASIWVAVIFGAMLIGADDLLFGHSLEILLIISIVATVPFRAYQEFTQYAIRGLNQINGYAILQALPNLAALVLLVAFMFVIDSHDLPVYVLLVSFVVAAGVGNVMIHASFKANVSDQGPLVKEITTREIMDISRPMFISTGMSIVTGHAGILILGALSNPEDVGLYSVAVKLALITSFISNAVSAYVSPNIAKCFFSGQRNELRKLLRSGTKLIFFATIPVVGILIAFGQLLLPLLFAPEFSAAYLPMIIILAGQLVSSISGPVANFLNMTGREKVVRNYMLMTTAINLALSLVLIPLFGLYGAAVSTMVGTVLWNVLLLIEIKRRDGFWMFYFPGR